MNNVASKNLSLHQMKLKKYPLKMNNSNQNLNLSKLKYQKKFHIDWKDMIRKSTQKKEKTKKKVKNWQKKCLCYLKEPICTGQILQTNFSKHFFF